MRVFIQRGKKKPLVWKIGVNDDVIVMESGVKGGKMKTTSDRVLSVGKPGTKAYRSPEVQAQEVALRHIREKVERMGYREVDPDTLEFLEDQTDDEINWKNPPKNMRFMKCRHQPKPDEKKKLAELMEVIDSGNAIFTIKRDGMMHPIFIDEEGDVHIFTRRFDRCTDHYPHIMMEVAACDFPPKTILLCEFVCTKNRKDSRKLVQTLDRSLPDRARKLQEDPFRRPKAIVLGIPYWGGEAIMATRTCDEWLEFMYDQFERVHKLEYLEPMQILAGDFDLCLELVEEKGWEGLVIYDGRATFGDAVVNFRGREERPKAWKWKIYKEGDFVVVFDPDGEFDGGFNKKERGKWGRGRLQGLPGNFALYQYDTKGDLHYISNVGSGFKEKEEKDLSRALQWARNNDGFVAVAEIKYESRTFIADGDDTNALTGAIFLRWRHDKDFDEAVEERLG